MPRPRTEEEHQQVEERLIQNIMKSKGVSRQEAEKLREQLPV